MSTAKKSYATEYYKTKELNFADYFNQYVVDTESATAIKKEINKLSKRLAEQNANYNILLNKRYNSEFVPINGNHMIIYCSKRTGETFYYDMESGMQSSFEDDIPYYGIDVTSKTGEIMAVVGFAYSLGSIILRCYKYSITSGNERINLVLNDEILMPIINPKLNSYRNFPDGNTTTVEYNRLRYSAIDSVLKRYPADEFINKFYGMDVQNCNLNLFDLKENFLKHPSMEMLIKQLPNQDMTYLSDLLLVPEKETNSPKKSIAQYLEVTKNELNDIYENHLIPQWVQFIKMTKELSEYPNPKWETVKALKTTPDWINLFIKADSWKQEFDFYHIHYDTSSLLLQLLKYYIGGVRRWDSSYKNLFEFYAFNEFCQYCVEGTINQGYTQLENFVSELNDYITMAIELNVTPNTSTAYLRQTHDLMSRNYKIQLNEEQESIFKSRYTNYKTWVSKDKRYMIVAPKDSEEVKAISNELDNCMSSYIHYVLANTSLLFFLRDTTMPTKTIVGIELKDNTIVQVKRSHNRPVTSEDVRYMQECCRAMGWKYRG